MEIYLQRHASSLKVEHESSQQILARHPVNFVSKFRLLVNAREKKGEFSLLISWLVGWKLFNYPANNYLTHFSYSRFSPALDEFLSIRMREEFVFQIWIEINT